MVADFSDDSFHSDYPLELIKPSRLVLPISLGSMVIGFMLGVFGLLAYFGHISNLSGAFLHILGACGAFLALVLPIGLTIQSERRHQTMCRKIHDLQDEGKSYDAYAGEQLRRRMSKLLMVAFLAAAAPIVVAAIPIGERFAA